MTVFPHPDPLPMGEGDEVAATFTMAMEIARLRWLCRRGSREMELMLLAYLDDRYPQAAPAERDAFRRLLELPEDRLQHGLLGQEPFAEKELAALVRQIRSAFNPGS